jgi:hypothetical protein
MIYALLPLSLPKSSEEWSFHFIPEKPKSTTKDYVILIWGARFYIAQAKGFLYQEGWSYNIPLGLGNTPCNIVNNV